MEDSCRYVAIDATLKRLERYATLSPFCRAFYRLIYELLGDREVDSAKLRQAFHIFLRCECRKHQAARRWVSAVNNWGQHGRWASHVCRDPQTLKDGLQELGRETSADAGHGAAEGEG